MKLPAPLTEPARPVDERGEIERVLADEGGQQVAVVVDQARALAEAAAGVLDVPDVLVLAGQVRDVLRPEVHARGHRQVVDHDVDRHGRGDVAVVGLDLLHGQRLVVRSHHHQPRGPGLFRVPGQRDRLPGGHRAGVREHGRAAGGLVQHALQDLPPLGAGLRGELAGRAARHQPVRTGGHDVLDEVAEGAVVHGFTVRGERRDERHQESVPTAHSLPSLTNVYNV